MKFTKTLSFVQFEKTLYGSPVLVERLVFLLRSALDSMIVHIHNSIKLCRVCIGMACRNKTIGTSMSSLSFLAGGNHFCEFALYKQ